MGRCSASTAAGCIGKGKVKKRSLRTSHSDYYCLKPRGHPLHNQHEPYQFLRTVDPERKSRATPVCLRGVLGAGVYLMLGPVQTPIRWRKGRFHETGGTSYSKTYVRPL